MPVPDFNFDQRADNKYVDDIKPKGIMGEVPDSLIPTEEEVKAYTEVYSANPLQRLLQTEEVKPTPRLRTADSAGVKLDASGMPIVGGSEPEYNPVQSYVDLMNIKAPRPVKDEDRQKRLETIAAAKGIGKALSVLGDVYGLAKGGYVPASQIKDNEPIVNQLLEDQRKYQERMSQAEFADYLNKLKIGQAVAGAKEREAAREGAIAAAESKAQQAERKFAFDVAKEQERSKLGRARLGEQERHNKAMEAAAKIRAEKTGTTSKGMYPLYSTGGQKLAEVNEGQLDKIFNIIKDKIPIGEDLELLKSQFGEGITKDHKRSIVSMYIDDPAVPEVRKFLGLDESASEPSTASGILPGFTAKEQPDEEDKKPFIFPGLTK